MKKFLLSILIFSTMISVASARDFRTIALGAKAGVNLSSGIGIPNLIGPMRANFTGGLFFEFRPIKVIGLSAELLYTGSGFQTRPINENGDVIDLKYNFIDIPIMARIYIAGGLSINAGVQATFLFSPTLNIGEIRSQFDTNKAMFAIPVGLSYTINSLGLTIEARYTYGLTPVLAEDSHHTTGGDFVLPAVNNQGIAFTIGWRFLSI